MTDLPYSTRTMKTIYLFRELHPAQLPGLLHSLRACSCWHAVVPCPDDMYAIEVKAEDAGGLRQMLKMTGALPAGTLLAEYDLVERGRAGTIPISCGEHRRIVEVPTFPAGMDKTPYDPAVLAHRLTACYNACEDLNVAAMTMPSCITNLLSDLEPLTEQLLALGGLGDLEERLRSIQRICHALLPRAHRTGQGTDEEDIIDDDLIN
jgi:hypothetical protein